MRDSVLLISWDNFLVTLPSICSKTCVKYSSLIPGTDVLPDWPFLGWYSGVSFETAAKFRFFIKVAILFQGKCSTVVKTDFFLFVSQIGSITKNWMNNLEQSVQSTDSQGDIKDLKK